MSPTFTSVSWSTLLIAARTRAGDRGFDGGASAYSSHFSR